MVCREYILFVYMLVVNIFSLLLVHDILYSVKSMSFCRHHSLQHFRSCHLQLFASSFSFFTKMERRHILSTTTKFKRTGQLLWGWSIYWLNILFRAFCELCVGGWEDEIITLFSLRTICTFCVLFLFDMSYQNLTSTAYQCISHHES